MRPRFAGGIALSSTNPTDCGAPTSVLFRGVFLVAVATLLCEITLIRVLSFTIWYHFAYVVISTALLGFGASGTLIAVRPEIGAKDLRSTSAWYCILAAVSTVGALAFISLVPLHPMEIFVRPSQALTLLAYQIIGTLPFFFSGIVISLALRAAAERVDRLYFWDLLGASVGCGTAVMLMNAVSPPGAMLISAGLFSAAASVYASEKRVRVIGGVLAGVFLLCSPLMTRVPFTPANSKHLSIHIKVQKMVPIFTHWSALFRTDVVQDFALGPGLDNDFEWGLSTTRTEPIQHPWGFVTHDASAGTGIYDLAGAGPLNHLEDHILQLPYLIGPPNPRVLVIGVGGGRDVITAIQLGASHVTGVELDPVTVEFVRGDPYGLSGGFFRRPDVELIAGEGRHFIKKTDKTFDIIQITAVDTLAAQSSGAYVLAENYLYTVEAMKEYLSKLRPGGLLSIATGHLFDNNPRAAGRMVSIAQRALRELGIDNPEDHIAVIGTYRLLCEVMISLTPFRSEQADLLVSTAERLKFNILHVPGRKGNRVFDGLASLAGAELDELTSTLKYVVEPTTDDSPFFFRYYRWKDLFSDWSTISPVHTTALGQIVLVVVLATLTVFGTLFVLVPLFVFRRHGISGGGTRRIGILMYFLAIGFGFMLFEISLMQRFVLFLGYPTYSLTVTLFSLLISLGFGSYLSQRWVGKERAVLPAAVAAITVLTVFYMKGLPPIQAALLGEPLAVRVLCTIAVLVPLGLVLGMFFPLGIRAAAEVHKDLVPWAWGVNGCASVSATVLAVILAMNYGFTIVWLLAIVIYALGVAALLLTDDRAALPADRA